MSTMPLVLSDEALDRLLQDDAPCGDLTTESLAIGSAAARLDFSARGPMVVCGLEEAARLFELAGARVLWRVDSGSALDAGARMLVVEGAAAQLHRAWKTAQTLVEWTSGIATAAAAIVAQAGGVAVACTRKNVPGTKALSVKAVKAGGAVMHRLGLSETLLVFAEHRLFLNEAPEHTVARLRRAQPEKKTVVAAGADLLVTSAPFTAAPRDVQVDFVRR